MARLSPSAVTSTTVARRLIRPWQLIEHGDRFEVIDAAGVSLAVVHFDNEPSQQKMLKRLSKEEARRLAQKVARLPALLRIGNGINPSEA